MINLDAWEDKLLDEYYREEDSDDDRDGQDPDNDEEDWEQDQNNYERKLDRRWD